MYKRQAFSSNSESSESLSEEVLAYTSVIQQYASQYGIPEYVSAIPVSYTHLDVYKRQGEPTQSIGKNFIRSYIGVCLEGAIIALACICLLYTSRCV